MPEFYMIHARKVNKIPEFYMIFARKMPEFHIIIAPKNFSRILEGHVSPCPPSPTPTVCPWASCSLHPGPGLTQPSIISGSVNEYRLRLGRCKAGMCDAAWCAPST